MTKKTNHIIHIRSNVHHTTHQVLYNIRIVDSFNITFSSSIWSHISKLRAMDLLKNYFNSWIATLRLLNNWGKWRGLHFVEFIQPVERSNVEPTRVTLAYSQPYKMRKVVHIVFFFCLKTINPIGASVTILLAVQISYIFISSKFLRSIILF